MSTLMHLARLKKRRERAWDRWRMLHTDATWVFVMGWDALYHEELRLALPRGLI